jgi:hypothetical protein
MNRDLLREATQALRDTPPVSTPDAARATRARVLGSVHEAKRSRVKRITFFIPLAALLIGSTAWATSGGGFEPLVDLVRGERPLDPPPKLELAVTMERAPRTPAPPPVVVPVAVPVASAAPAASSPPPPPVDGEALYRAAHHAHFVDKNPGAALAAWNAYLAAAPRGRFVLEALYNRALCLVRLGQTSAALAALAPFADGRHGSYRQAEATQLREALSK